VISGTKRTTRPHPAQVVAFPRFDENGACVFEWLGQVDEGRIDAAVLSLCEAHRKLCRVRHSPRHIRLAEFLHHAILALQSGEFEGARYILMTALDAFGWA
jgi:hypothetical protein